MKQQDFFNLSLPKWPALVVVGEPVTREQAMEILIRTDGLRFGGNHRERRNQLNSYLYDVEIPSKDTCWDALEKAIIKKLGTEGESFMNNGVWSYEEQHLAEVGQISLEYLTNHQIISSWIGGAHGWCHWNGEISCNNYNIGKWPSVKEVFDEWKEIAKAFPFLDLRCQLMNHETSYEDKVKDPRPVVEFRVKGGRVTMKLPKAVLKLASRVSPMHGLMHDLIPDLMFANEIGCTMSQFKAAVDLCRTKFKSLKPLKNEAVHS